MHTDNFSTLGFPCFAAKVFFSDVCFRLSTPDPSIFAFLERTAYFACSCLSLNYHGMQSRCDCNENQCSSTCYATCFVHCLLRFDRYQPIRPIFSSIPDNVYSIKSPWFLRFYQRLISTQRQSRQITSDHVRYQIFNQIYERRFCLSF